MLCYQLMSKIAIALYTVMLFMVVTNVTKANNVFLVKDIRIDITDRSSQKARNKAIGQARSIAFKEVVSRLITSNQVESIKKSLSPNNADLKAMTAKLKIDNEKFSTIRYLADITVEFSADKVQKYLQQQNFPFTITPTEVRTVVLPRAFPNSNIKYFNKWIASWKRYDVKTGQPSLTPLNIYSSKDSDIEVKQVLDFFLEDKLLGLVNAEVNSDGVFLATLVKIDRSNTKYYQDKYLFKKKVETDDNFDELINKAVDNLYSQLNDDHKQTYALNKSESSKTYVVGVNITSLKEWLTLKGKLDAIKAINNLRNDLMKTERMYISFDSSADLETLILLLRQQNLRFGYNKDEELWEIYQN